MAHPTHPVSGARSDGAGPARIGRYAVIRELGRGGMGVVYEGLDAELDRRVAIKVLLEGGEQAPEDLARFQREARTVAKLEHESIVRVFDVGVERGRPFIVMEYVEGRDLRVALRGGVERETALRALADAATALSAAHAAGVIHRDVKPENIIIRGDTGRGALMDFGVAKTGDVRRLTQTGMLVGTPDYMAPEQLDGEPSSASDVYALGATLYDILTGRPPYVAETMIALFTMITTERVTPPSAVASDVPARLEQLALACLEPETEARPTAREVARVLERYLAGQDEARGGVGGPGRFVFVLVASLALAAGLAAWALTRPPPVEARATSSRSPAAAETPEPPAPSPQPTRTAAAPSPAPTPESTPTGPALRRTISWSVRGSYQGLEHNGGTRPNGRGRIFLGRDGNMHVGFTFLLEEPNITWAHLRLRHSAKRTRPERWSEVSIKLNKRLLSRVRVEKRDTTYLEISPRVLRGRPNQLRVKFLGGPSVYNLQRVDVRYGTGDPPPLEEWSKSDAPAR